MTLLLGNSVNVVTGTEMDFQSPVSIEFEDAQFIAEPLSARRAAAVPIILTREEFFPAESLEWDDSFEPAGAGALADWPL